MDSIVQPAATEQPSSSRNRLLLAVYTAAIFVSALLLFSVQPLFTKMVLPRVWAARRRCGRSPWCSSSRCCWRATPMRIC
ncbi:hypothetical protein AB7M41_003889 [Bradyrhizobium diazoefficiens]